MKGFLNFLSIADQWVSRITRTICIISMATVFVMFLLNVFVRFVPIYNFTQTDEWTQLFLVWVIFFGAQELVRTKSHFVVDVLTDKVQGTRLGKILRIITTVIELIMYAVICYYGWVLVGRAQAYMQSIPWMQMKYFYAGIPVSATFKTMDAIRDVSQAIRLPWNK